jgi:hypothetical protein
MIVAALGGDNPRAIHKRGLMPHMLAMAAGQVGHPIAMFITMIPDNRLVHEVMLCVQFVIERPLAFFESELWALRRRKVGPSFLAIRIETAEKHDLPVEMPKLREHGPAVLRIDDTGIELPHDIDHPFTRQIDIAASGIACVGK